MLRFLDSVRNGTVEGSCLKLAERTRRAHSLELSKHMDVEQVHCGGVNSLHIDTIEGRYMLSGGSDGTIAVHDLDNVSGKPEYTAKCLGKIGRNYARCHRFSVETVSWYPVDTGMFISSGLDGLLKLWDTNTLKRVSEFQLSDHIYQHHLASLSSTCNLIAVARATSRVMLVDLKSGSATHELQGHSAAVMTVRWSPTHEHVLASGSYDNSLNLWDVRSPKALLHRFDQHNKNSSSCKSAAAHSGRVNGLCFNADGRYLFSYGTDNHLHMWDVFTGQKETVNFGKIENENRKAVKFDVSHHTSPDVVYVPCKGRICAYDTQNGTQVSKLIGHYNVVNCCTIHPFYQEVYSGGNDHNILVWTPDQEQADAYDADAQVRSSVPRERNSFVKQINLTADAWSDDEN